jgi:hypothetical protein
MNASVSPVLQTFPVGKEEIKSTEPPSQKLSGPLDVMVGCIGVFTTTETGAETGEAQPKALVVATVKFPGVVTTIV